MRILITGHTGYIGTVLSPMLLAQDYDVVGLDTNYYGGCDFGYGLQVLPQIQKDLRDVNASDMDGFDAIVHLAALSDDPLGNLNPALTYKINHAASVRLAKLARETGAERFLFASSCSVYGAAGNTMLDERAAFNPVTPYGITKVRVERDLMELADEDFSPVFLRNATAYGVSPRLRFGLVLNDLVALALTTGRVYLKSDGTPWRPIIHVEDICLAIIATLDASREAIHNQAFNVGVTSENYQIRELAEIVHEIVPDCRIEYAPDAGPDRRTYRVNFSKIETLLPGFEPQWNARKGVKQLCEAFQKAGLTLEDFNGPKYKRIDRIKELLMTNQLDERLRWTEKIPV